jgi:hypothetical protein
MVGVGKPIPGQLWLTLAGCGRLWRAAVGFGQLRSAMVHPSLAMCGRPCTIALVRPSKVYSFIAIPIFVYLQGKIPTQLVELY